MELSWCFSLQCLTRIFESKFFIPQNGHLNVDLFSAFAAAAADEDDDFLFVDEFFESRTGSNLCSRIASINFEQPWL